MSDLIKVQDNEVIVKEEVLQKLKHYNEVKILASMLEQELKRDLEEVMVEYGIKVWDNEVFKATYVLPTIRKHLDTKRLKEEQPDLYNEFLSESNVKGSVRIKYHD